MRILIWVGATTTIIFGIISFIRLRPTLRLPFFPSLRSVAITFAPFSAALGTAVAIIAAFKGMYVAFAFGSIGAIMALYKIKQVNPHYRPFTSRPPKPVVERDVDVHGVLCDVWHPTSPSSGVALINLHGGAWFAGDKGFTGLASLFRHLTACGYTVVDVAYPLAPQASLTDQLDAIYRVITAYQTKYRIVVFGASSGGHLALMVSYTSTYIDAVIAYSPPTDLETLVYDHYSWDNALTFIREGGQTWLNGRTWAEASPLTYVTKDCPPTLLLHGEADMIVPVEQSRRLCDALRSAEVPVELICYRGVGHAFETPVWGPSAQIAMKNMISYLDEKVMISRKSTKEQPR